MFLQQLKLSSTDLDSLSDVHYESEITQQFVVHLRYLICDAL